MRRRHQIRTYGNDGDGRRYAERLAEAMRSDDPDFVRDMDDLREALEAFACAFRIGSVEMGVLCVEFLENAAAEDHCDPDSDWDAAVLNARERILAALRSSRRRGTGASDPIPSRRTYLSAPHHSP